MINAAWFAEVLRLEGVMPRSGLSKSTQESSHGGSVSAYAAYQALNVIERLERANLAYARKGSATANRALRIVAARLPPGP
jgi:hypothetical protein